MADVTIDSSVSSATGRAPRSIVFTTPLIGYQFYIDATTFNFVYRKTTDGGATWSPLVTIDAATTHIAFDVWFDQWTPGDAGTLIHVWFHDTTSDDVFWRSLDTASDTLGTERMVFAGASGVAGRGVFVSGTKTRSGYLYCAYDIDAGAEKGLHRSTDSGTTWSASLDATFVEATLDQCFLFPASNTGDDNDCWAVYHDADTNDLTLKMWDSSAGAQVESASIMGLTEGTTDLTGQYGFSASVRHSDGHLIVAAVSERDTATADHRVFDVNGTGSITEKTAITTNIDDHYHPAVFIDQNTDDIYVFYNGNRSGSQVLGTTTQIFYTKSTDDGASWSAGDTAYKEGGAAVLTNVWAPLMGPRLCASWRQATTGLITDFINSLDLTPSGVTGTVARTTGADTLNAAGKVDIAGTLARTVANDTLNAAGLVQVIGSVAVTLAGATSAASGTVSNPAVTGTLSRTAANDTITAAGLVTVTGTLARTPGNDTMVAVGLTPATGALARTTGDDALAGSGLVVISGSVAKTTADDSRAISGLVTVSGSLARTGANDAMTAAGLTPATGTLAGTNQPDTLSAGGAVGTGVTGSLARTNADDGLAASGLVAVVGSLTGAGAGDALAAAGLLHVIGNLSRLNGNDSLSASGLVTLIGAVACTNAPDGISATGLIQITGSMALSGGDDLASASGVVTGAQITGTAAAAAAPDIGQILGRVFGGAILSVPEERVLGLVGGTRAAGLDGGSRVLPLPGGTRAVRLDGGARVVALEAEDDSMGVA